MRVTYLSGPLAGQSDELPQTEAENAIATGFAAAFVAPDASPADPEPTVEPVAEVVADIVPDGPVAGPATEVVAPPATANPEVPKSRRRK